MMKGTLLTATLLSFAGLAVADEAKTTTVQPALNADTIRYVLTTERRNVFEEAFKLQGKDKDTFWNLYGQYEKDKGQLDKERLQVLGEFVQKYPTLTSKQSLDLIDRVADFQKTELKLREKYARKIEKEIGGNVGTRFWQVDDYINSAIRLGMLSNIPLTGDKANPK